MNIQRKIVTRLFESRGLVESEFESGGKRYTCAFGRYSCDGKEISREEYFKAKENVDSGDPEVKSDSGVKGSPVSYLENDHQYDLKDLLDKDDDQLKKSAYNIVFNNSKVGRYLIAKDLHRGIRKAKASNDMESYTKLQRLYSVVNDAIDASEELVDYDKDKVANYYGLKDFDISVVAPYFDFNDTSYTDMLDPKKIEPWFLEDYDTKDWEFNIDEITKLYVKAKDTGDEEAAEIFKAMSRKFEDLRDEGERLSSEQDDEYEEDGYGGDEYERYSQRWSPRSYTSDGRTI